MYYPSPLQLKNVSCVYEAYQGNDKDEYTIEIEIDK